MRVELLLTVTSTTTTITKWRRQASEAGTADFRLDQQQAQSSALAQTNAIEHIMSPCFCDLLHESCDPAKCVKAGRTWQPGPERIPLAQLSESNCQTCELIVRGLNTPEIRAIWEQPGWIGQPDEGQLQIGWAGAFVVMG